MGSPNRGTGETSRLRDDFHRILGAKQSGTVLKLGMEPEEIALEVYLALLVLVSALFRAFRIFLSVTQHPMFSTGKSMGPAAEFSTGCI